MGLRVDRQAALGWLGIEAYRPSGRLRPVMPRPAVDAGVPAELTEAPAAEGVDRPVDAFEVADIPVQSPAPDQPETIAAAPANDAPEAVAAEPAAADRAPADGLQVTADSPHRPLAEAIGRVAGLPCETADSGDVLHVGGHTWELAALAGDGQAKRRLWRSLIARGRRLRA